MEFAEQKIEGGVQLLLPDGNQLVVKVAVGNVTDTGTKALDGTPIYNVQAQPVVFVIPRAAASSEKH